MTILESYQALKLKGNIFFRAVWAFFYGIWLWGWYKVQQYWYSWKYRNDNNVECLEDVPEMRRTMLKIERYIEQNSDFLVFIMNFRRV